MVHRTDAPGGRKRIWRSILIAVATQSLLGFVFDGSQQPARVPWDEIEQRIRRAFLNAVYSLSVAAVRPYRTLFDSVDGKVRLTIEEVGPQASVTRDGRIGVVNPRLDWRHCRQSEADSILLEVANQSDE